MNYHIVNESGVILFSNMTETCMDCYHQCGVKSQSIDKCSIDNKKRRNGIEKHNGNHIFICSESEIHTKSSRRFKEKLELYIEFTDDFKLIKSSIISSINKDVKRLLHNLTSLNAHNIQEVYALVPQDVLSENLRSQISIIKEAIAKDTDETAFTILRVAKNNASMKNEFSVFRKLFDQNPILQHKFHPIKKVCLNLFHIFFQDFTDNKIYVQVCDCDFKVKIDYESFHVALYHLIDNASKYTQPNSTLKVSFSRDKEHFKIQLDMMSLRILPEELQNLTQEGFSGHYAKILGKAGDGIGMSLVYRLLALNDAAININNNVSPGRSIAFNNVEYENNQFEIIFPSSHIRA